MLCENFFFDFKGRGGGEKEIHKIHVRKNNNFKLTVLSKHVTKVHPLVKAVVQEVHVPLVMGAQVASHPSTALLLVSNLLVAQATAVHPLAKAVVQAVQVPVTVPSSVKSAHPASHPSAALLLVSNLLVAQETAVHPLATAEVQAEHVPPATVAQQLKSSLSDVVVANWLEGQVEHAFASTNGFNSGFDM